MKVLAKPAFSNKSKNPYNYLLYNNLEKIEGFEVQEFTPQRALVRRYDILHIHWPEIMLFRDSTFKSFFSVIVFLFLVVWMKIRGAAIVWTIHNLKSHQFAHKSKPAQHLEEWYINKFVSLLDGVITLSNASFRQAKQVYPAISTKQHVVIPHGHYRSIYPSKVSRDEARKKLQIRDDDFVIGYFGQILPYKNVFGLVQAFKNVELDNIHLLVAGKPVEEELANEIRQNVGNSANISLRLSFIPGEEVQHIFRASDLMVIPYSNVLNSGSAILALSFDVPVLVPKQGSLKELQQQIGSEWVQTYSQPFTAEILETAVRNIMNNPVQERCAALDKYGWMAIAEQTYEAYQDVIAK